MHCNINPVEGVTRAWMASESLLLEPPLMHTQLSGIHLQHWGLTSSHSEYFAYVQSCQPLSPVHCFVYVSVSGGASNHACSRTSCHSDTPAAFQGSVSDASLTWSPGGSVGRLAWPGSAAAKTHCGQLLVLKQIYLVKVGSSGQTVTQKV